MTAKFTIKAIAAATTLALGLTVFAMPDMASAQITPDDHMHHDGPMHSGMMHHRMMHHGWHRHCVMVWRHHHRVCR